MTKKKRKPSNEIIQSHHNSYKPVYEELMTRTEHFIIGNVNRHTVKISKGFLRSLEYYILTHFKEAVELERT